MGARLNETEVGDDVLPDDHAFGDLEPERFEMLAEETTVEMPDGEEEPLVAVMDDITTAHEELNDYKNGGLATVGALDEAIIEARAEQDEERAQALEIVKEAAFGVYLRVQRGDGELFGDREGHYDDYFDDL